MREENIKYLIHQAIGNIPSSVGCQLPRDKELYEKWMKEYKSKCKKNYK